VISTVSLQTYALIIHSLPLPCFSPTVRPVFGHSLFLYSSMAHAHTLPPMQGHGSFQSQNAILLLLLPLYAVSHILFPHSSPWSWWLQFFFFIHSFIFRKSFTRYEYNNFYNKKKQQLTVYTYKICEKFVSVCGSNIQLLTYLLHGAESFLRS
jgi:hypothetical protein